MKKDQSTKFLASKNRYLGCTYIYACNRSVIWRSNSSVKSKEAGISQCKLNCKLGNGNKKIVLNSCFAGTNNKIEIENRRIMLLGQFVTA